MYQRDFDFSKSSEKYQLSVVLMADSFFYGLFDPKGSLVYHRSHVHFDYSKPSEYQVLLEDQQLAHDFEKVNVLIWTDHHFQLPEIRDDFVNMFPSMDFKVVKREKIPGQQVYHYYAITKYQESLLVQLFHNKKTETRSFLTGIAAYYIAWASDLMHVHIEENKILIYAQKNNEMVFYQTFKTESATDVLYFILAACESSGLEISNDDVYISGWIEKDSPMFKTLSGYVSKLHFRQDVEFKLSPLTSKETKEVFYFAHFVNKLCAS